MIDNDKEAIELGFKNKVDFEESIVSSKKINVFDKLYKFKKEKIILIILFFVSIIFLCLEAIISKKALDIISIPSNFASFFIITLIIGLINLFKLEERMDNVNLSNRSLFSFTFNNFAVLKLTYILKPLHFAFYIISTIGSIWNMYYLIFKNVNKEYFVISIIVEVMCLIMNIIVIVFSYKLFKEYNKVNYIGKSLKTLKEFDLTYDL